MLERRFKQKVKRKHKDWIFIELIPGAGVPMGFPDTLAIKPDGTCAFIEWKRSKNAQKQPLQQYWHDKLKEMQHDVMFISPETEKRLNERRR